MKIGYVRVSTTGQNTARQDIAMTGMDKVFSEKISGKNTERSELQKMLAFVHPGDTVYVESLSRLARSTRDLLNITAQIHKSGGDLVSLKENIDTSSPQGKLVFTIFAALAEFERETILQRQAEGIAAAKAAGKHLGRKFKRLPNGSDKVVKQWADGVISTCDAMQALQVSRSTLYRLAEKAPD